MIFKFLVGRRIIISRECILPLIMGLTIAIRYSCVRKQFRTYANDPTRERPLIEYQMQQVKLFSLLAEAYAMLFASTQLLSIYQSSTDNELFEINALSMSYKAYFTEVVTSGIETCRQACGGHGFSNFSGLPFLYTTSVISKSFEGENAVLLANSAKILVHLMERKGNSEFTQIVNEKIASILIDDNIGTPQFHSACLKAILNLSAKEVQKKLKELKDNNTKDIENKKLQIAAINLVKYFGNYHMHEAFAM